MNYRHAYHAGNFADVVKHALLVRLVEYMKRKEKPFRVIDTHAGRGRYDLAADEARRTGEHLSGIVRLLDAPGATPTLLQPYVDIVRQTQGDAPTYPGSPLIVRKLLRRQDRLSAYELHPEDAEALAALFAGDHQVKTIRLDGWLALGAHLPPKEKRGLVLIDPPFEVAGEIDRMVDGLIQAHRRWPGGIYALWHPLKRPAERDRLHRRLKESGIPGIVAAELLRAPFTADERLVGSGLIVVNPPFTFRDEAKAILGHLEPLLAEHSGGESRVELLTGEQS